MGLRGRVFLKSYLDDVNKIEFIQVGYDGTYRFETVEYTLIDEDLLEKLY